MTCLFSVSTFATHISFIVDVCLFVSISPLMCTSLPLFSAALYAFLFIFVLRIAGNHLTNHGYLINYQNGYVTVCGQQMYIYRVSL